MKMRLLIVLMILAFPISTFAETRANESVVFQKEENILLEDFDAENKTIPNHDSEHLIHCQKLSKEVNNLEGKPLRKSAAIERYKLECVKAP